MTESRSSPDVDVGQNGGPGTLSNSLSGILETFEALQRYHDLIGEAVSWVDCHRINKLVPLNESTWHRRSHFSSGQLSVSRAVQYVPLGIPSGHPSPRGSSGCVRRLE
jgi:hypothetical protein